jgi:hypothetical protein
VTGQNSPPDFFSIASESDRKAFLRGHPDVVERLPAGTKLFKWTAAITTSRGVSPWWQFLEARRLANGAQCPGIAELETYARRLGAHDRDYARARVAVTKQWNPMTNCVGIELLVQKWGYIGKAAGQRVDANDRSVFYIGGEYQVWIPGMVASEIRRLPIVPHLPH